MFQKLFLAALTTGAALSDLTAQSWFVRAGAQGGDGTQASPFGDPWQALDRCQAGDTVHIAEGKYFGRLGVGMWEIPFDRVQLLGGYAADFSERNPWAHPTQLLWDKASKNRPNQSRLLVKAKGAVVDGITIDMRDQNEYVDEQQSGRKDRNVEETAIRLNQPGTVRNCVVVNASQECVVTPPGSTIQNNLFLNAVIYAVNVTSGDPKVITTIKDNTILFSWDNKSPGKGVYRGTAIHLGQQASADISGNILANNDNNAIYTNGALDRTSITNNVFAMNLFANLLTGEGGTKAVVDDQTMELLEEVGLKAIDGNQVVAHELPIDAAWLDLYSKRTASQTGKVVMDDWNKLRQLAGLPLMGTGYQVATGVAPPYSLEKALQLVLARKATPAAGARVVALPVSFPTSAPVAATKSYQRSEVQTWHRSPDPVNGKPLEMVVAISGAANVSGIPAGLKPDEHLGTKLYDVEGQGAYVTGFYRKGSSAERVVSQDSGWYQGSGKPTRLHLVRGTAYALNGIPKAGFVIDSIERYEPVADAKTAADKRPKGRDWFVRAGNMGGDGSKEKPFRDPFQALEKCQSGDTIHVAGGEYHGKLKAGRWRIEVPYVALLGGYDANFTERAPWANPTRLLCPPDFKGTRGGVTIEGDGDHTGAIVDGFVFDKRTNNNYGQDGNLVDERTDHTIQLRLERPESVVRNCIFVNGGEGGILVGNGMVVENNLFMNHIGAAIVVRGGHTTAPFTLRNNTILFNWERAGRFGKGMGYGGEAIIVESQSRGSIEGNILEFNDNNAIRFNADPKDVRLTDNVFAHNLWSILYRTESIIDDATFGMLGDFGFAASTGNRILTPGIPLDGKWFDRYLQRTAYVPGKVQMDDWNKLREILGEPMLATGGQAASCRAPAYDWQQCLTMVPKNPECTAGARPARMAATFTGIVREEVSHEYTETPWTSARSADSWAALDGKRVAIKVGVQRSNNNFQLDDIKKEEYDCYAIIGPEGLDGGLPMNCYVKRGSSAERVLRTAKMSERGAPDQLYLLSGIARGRRTLVVEVAAKAD
ncbi:MAG: right-handed parallel beta-helix repeat-containing protein [Planctomycetes bacterium]|nr:right-handed parallel beta-helix repeat-containing protein [Planctomycetota bacterium]